MPKFFVDPGAVGETSLILTGDDAAHIAKTLRMRPGEQLTVCDGDSCDYVCRLLTVSPSQVEAEILSRAPCPGEPELALTLYMALPKSDKLELVVQKAVELGVSRICVYRSTYCVPDPDRKSFEKRLQRLQRIAREAAGQSRRGRIPEVTGLLTYREMLQAAAREELSLFFYERGGTSLKSLMNRRKYHSISLVIGPEGGFSEEEHRLACEAGLETAYLGPRILRCETAAVCAAAAVMYHADELA